MTVINGNMNLSPYYFQSVTGTGINCMPGESCSEKGVGNSSETGELISVKETQENISENEEKNSTELSEEEQKEVEKLKKRDAEVRQHEQAHIAAGGNLVRGGANFQYENGPDGKRYAVGGEVSIAVSGGKTPQETIQKAQQIKRAALAPANPSAQDRTVAADASRMEMEARMEMQKEKISGEEEGMSETEGDEKSEINSSSDISDKKTIFKQAMNAYGTQKKGSEYSEPVISISA